MNQILPTQMQILETKLRQRDCPHEKFRMIGWSQFPDGRYEDYVCEVCGLTKQVQIFKG